MISIITETSKKLKPTDRQDFINSLIFSIENRFDDKLSQSVGLEAPHAAPHNTFVREDTKLSERCSSQCIVLYLFLNFY